MSENIIVASLHLEGLACMEIWVNDPFAYEFWRHQCWREVQGHCMAFFPPLLESFSTYPSSLMFWNIIRMYFIVNLGLSLYSVFQPGDSCPSAYSFLYFFRVMFLWLVYLHALLFFFFAHFKFTAFFVIFSLHFDLSLYGLGNFCNFIF